jgi:predicted secreted hydrolase
VLAALCALGLAPAAVLAVDAETPYAPVLPRHPLQFPRDYGSHPDFRTEWWYVTGWLTTANGQSLGFQVTFFRTKPAVDARNPSAFTPRQLLIAHCAVSDPGLGHLRHDQRIRRAGMGLAEAAEGDTRVWIDDWLLGHRAAALASGSTAASAGTPAGVYETHIVAEDFALRLALAETQPPMLNGDAGLSRKGPDPRAASYYYSVPHLKVTGTVARGDRTDTVSGEAWLDHEWSSEYLDTQAAGWDWIGINLDDGGALMAFQIRGLTGQPLWAGGSLRGRDGGLRILASDQVRFQAGQLWTSPRTDTSYPVKWRIQVGEREFSLQPLMDDQENDARLSTGAIYWEGAVRALEGRQLVGRGYLELTGHGERLRLR